MSLGLVFAVLLPSLLWKVDEARRDPANRAAWLFVIAFCCWTTTFVMALVTTTGLARTIVELDPHLIQITVNVANTGTFAALQVFYLRFIRGDKRHGRTRFEIALAAAVLVTLTVLTVYRDSMGGNLRPPDAEYLRSPDNAAFYIVQSGYVVYVLTMMMGWTSRHVRSVPGLVLRTAVGIAGVGAVMIWTSQVLRVGLTVIALCGGSFPPEVFPLVVKNLVRLGGPLLMGGLALPVIVWRLSAGHRWCRDLWRFRRLGPLWYAVKEAYPELIRPPAPVFDLASGDDGAPLTRLRERSSRSPVHLALQARLTQCRDGCLRAVQLVEGNTPATANCTARHIAESITSTTLRSPARDSAEGDDLPHLIAVSQTMKERRAATFRA